ncbi:MAG: hypothetical protein JRJ58_03110 [Deltaproteobacteria bacterium]|nr:hypothetical protein [Deltaproteobacteria bacterium]
MTADQPLRLEGCDAVAIISIAQEGMRAFLEWPACLRLKRSTCRDGQEED